LPVTSHTRAMWTLHIYGGRSHERLTSPIRVAVTPLTQSDQQSLRL
jgi:hypothetical protein